MVCYNSAHPYSQQSPIALAHHHIISDQHRSLSLVSNYKLGSIACSRSASKNVRRASVRTLKNEHGAYIIPFVIFCKRWTKNDRSAPGQITLQVSKLLFRTKPGRKIVKIDDFQMLIIPERLGQFWSNKDWQNQRDVSFNWWEGYDEPPLLRPYLEVIFKSKTRVGQKGDTSDKIWKKIYSNCNRSKTKVKYCSLNKYKGSLRLKYQNIAKKTWLNVGDNIIY